MDQDIFSSDPFDSSAYDDALLEMEQLDTLEETLKKLNRNSLILKIVTVALLAFALLGAGTPWALAAASAAVAGILLCWIEDGVFLRRKRLEGRLYREILKGGPLAADLAISTLQARYPDREMKFFRCFTAREVLWFYYPVIVMGILIAVFAGVL